MTNSNINDKKNLPLQTNKDILMFHQTTIRNVALTTAVSFAALGYSRFYRGKSLLYSSGLVLVSVLLVLCSILLNVNVNNIVVKHYNLDNNLNASNNFVIVNQLFLAINILTLFFSIYTFYRLITNNKFE